MIEVLIPAAMIGSVMLLWSFFSPDAAVGAVIGYAGLGVACWIVVGLSA